MTTIAADARSGLMVSDSRCNYGDAWFPCTKVYRINGQLIGISGEGKDEIKFLKWFRGTQRSPFPKLESFSAILLNADGVYVITANGSQIPIDRGFHAVGSGGSAALGAMLAGATLEQAVGIAAQIDAYTGGTITAYALNVANTATDVAEKATRA